MEMAWAHLITTPNQRVEGGEQSASQKESH
jgi:hypothetical protein